MTQLEGLKNFAGNIEDIMSKINDAVNEGKGKPASLTLSEQNSMFQFYLEVIDYLGKS